MDSYSNPEGEEVNGATLEPGFAALDEGDADDVGLIAVAGMSVA